MVRICGSRKREQVWKEEKSAKVEGEHNIDLSWALALLKEPKLRSSRNVEEGETCSG